MAATKIENIIENTMFGKYLIKAIVEKSALIRSGIAAIDARIAEICNSIGVQGRVINMPYWNDLIGDSEVIEGDGKELTVNPITAGQDVAVILRRGKAWGSYDLSAELAGDDPMRVVGDRVAEYWVREQQNVLFKTLDGVFASNVLNNAGDLVLDITKEAGDMAYLTPDTLLFAAQLLGDAKTNLAAIAMHSMVETVLNAGGNTSALYKASDTPGVLPTYNGRNVVMDDGCAYDSDTGIADVTLFGRGAVALNSVPMKTEFEVERSALAGEDRIVTRLGWISHVRGVKFADASVAKASPNNAELAMAANWTRVWDKKDVRVVRLRCKIAPGTAA